MPPINHLRALTAEQLKGIGDYFANYRPGLEGVIIPGEGFLLGSIIWQKSLGKPNINHIADGFTILIKHTQSVLDYTPPAHFIEIPVILPVNDKWDATPPVGDDYVVSFVIGGLGNDEGREHRTTYTVEVIISETVEWTSEVPFILRRVSPPVRNFKKGPANVWLEPFNVVKRPAVEFEPGVLVSG